MILESKQMIASDYRGFFGDRKVIYVKYPISWKVQDIVAKLTYAKTWIVDSVYNYVVVRAIVKPQYLERFRRENDKWVVPHKVLVHPDGECSYIVEDTIYDR